MLISLIKQLFIAGVIVMIALPVIAKENAFLKSPCHVGSHLPVHAVTNRAFQGIPSMAVTQGGRLWATWYAGKTPKEDHNNYVVLSTSGDNGATWHEVLIVDPDSEGPVRAYDPELWLGPDGKLRLAWAQAVGHATESTGPVAGIWFLETDEPELAQPRWGKPRRITDGIMMCKPTVLSSGEWILPASTWRKTDNSAKMVVSTDQGKTWAVRSGCNVPEKDRAFDEHMFVERKDGSLWLLARTRYGIGESVSTDRGATWPDLKPSAIAHPSARFFITRLISGNLLLVKHGPITERTGRSHLMAFVSTDDGATWGTGLLLDDRKGVSYPDGQQTVDGLIRIIYDYSRTDQRNILMATFREEDVVAGKSTSGSVRFRKIVSDASNEAIHPGILSTPNTPAEPPTVEESHHVKVYFEEGRFAAWPANGGMWTWGDEILVGFVQGFLGDPKIESGHLIDRKKPTNPAFGRSLDGGETWDVTPAILPGGPSKPMPTDLPLTDSNFILTARGENMYTSKNKGHTWQGPWKLPFSETMTLQARTDYHVLGEKDLLLLLSAVKPNGAEGRPFSARTLDGGKTWNQFTWIGEQPKTRFSIMPSSIRLESGRLLAAIRRREDVPFYNNNFIELFSSDDDGLTWNLLSVPTTDLGEFNGNPPSLLQLADGRLCITTAHRSKMSTSNNLAERTEPSHIFAVFSEDDGKTWSKKRVLRGNGGGWDLGYSQSMQRSDGKVVTIYYFHETLNGERYIAATIWKP